MAGISDGVTQWDSAAALLERHRDLAVEVQRLRQETGSSRSGALSLEEIALLAERWSRSDVPPIRDASGFHQEHREKTSV
ncbi:MAG: hypothetical protein Q4D96_05540 [Propionibacteriaceae bacterium]|nr:hypothetical protein [Propionibacteriaceae bacterium]